MCRGEVSDTAHTHITAARAGTRQLSKDIPAL